MSKSPAVIAAIGIGGCLALSLMMRQVLEVKRDQDRDPIEVELEARFPRRLSGPVQVSSSAENGKLVVIVELRVIAGLRKSRFVEPAGHLAWNMRLGTAEEPDEVVVMVTDDGAGETLTESVRRPRSRR